MAQYTAPADKKSVKMNAPEPLTCLICAKGFNNSEFDQQYYPQRMILGKGLTDI